MNGEDFTTNVHLLPLNGYDIILGIEWLSSLGNITCNFSNLTMVIEQNGHKIVLRGVADKKVKPVSSSKMNRLVASEAHLALIQVTPLHTQGSLHSLTMKNPESITTEILSLMQQYPKIFLDPLN